MIPLAQRPATGFAKPGRLRIVARQQWQLGQGDQEPLGWDWGPGVTVKSIGGLLLASGSITSMLVSTDKRLAPQIFRVLTALFGTYLVADETWYRSGNFASTPYNTFVLPSIGIAAAIAALSGIGYAVFKNK